MLQNALRKLALQQRTMSYFYAVARGHQVGIYDSWAKCQEQVNGFKGARYKKFPTRADAESFIKEESCETGNYFPKDIAVPLGSKKRDKKVEKATEQKRSAESNAELEDFWPESDGDSFNGDEFTDAELFAATVSTEKDINQSDTSTSCSSLKRKANWDNITSKKSSKLAKYQSKVWEAVGKKHIDGYEFALDEEGYVIVYTDGSCINNGQKNACAGFGVYFGDDHALNAASPVTGRVTNNVGEIQAAIHAIKVAKDMNIAKLCISTDSQFLIKSATCWMSTWKKKNWKLKDGGDVKNVVDFKELDALLHSGKVLVKWNYVKAHKGIKGNEMADRLARSGSDKYRLKQKK